MQWAAIKQIKGVLETLLARLESLPSLKYIGKCSRVVFKTEGKKMSPSKLDWWLDGSHFLKLLIMWGSLTTLFGKQ